MLTGKLSNMIKRHEGLRLSPYKCPAGKKTIGYGHNLEASPITDKYLDHYLASNNSITEHMAEWILDQDILHAGVAAETITPTWPTINDARRAVIISMIFNLGIQGYTQFRRMRSALDAGDWRATAAEMRDSAWYHQVGSRGEELSRMMETGEWK